jgi:hypothetical protein
VIGKAYNIVAILAIAHLLALGGLVGYLVQSGRLSPERAGEIADLLRGDPAVEGDEAADDTPADESVAQDRETASEAVKSSQQIAVDREAQQLRRASVERAEQDLRAQRELLEQVLRDQIAQKQEFDRGVQRWKQQKEKLQQAAQDTGFQRELDYFSKLPPKQAKEILMSKWKRSPADAVRMLNAVKTSVGQDILQTMKEPEEMQIMYELLEQLGKQDMDRLAPGSGTNSADASG